MRPLIRLFFFAITTQRCVLASRLKEFLKKQNSVHIGGSVLRDTKIKFHGKNNKLIIGNNCYISGSIFGFCGDNNIIEVLDNVTINANKLSPSTFIAGGGGRITIGKFSLLSDSLYLSTTDFHKVYNSLGKERNAPKDIVIGEHCWIGRNCQIMKGVMLCKNTIVAASSVVTKNTNIEFTAIGGNPAKVILQSVNWEE